MLKLNFLVIDLETTGLNPANSEIIEIGAVKVENGVLTGHFQMLVKPQQMPSPEISDLTGITPEMLIDAPPLSVALQALLDFAGAIGFWVAHNKDFEASFLEAHLEQQPNWLDSIDIAKIALPQERYFRLGHLLQVMQIEHGQLHRALADAEATARLLLLLLERLRELPDQIWQEFMLICTPCAALPLATLLHTLNQQRQPQRLTFPEAENGWQPAAEYTEQPERGEPVTNYRLAPEQINQFFQSLPTDKKGGFELRPEQINMSEQVTAAFNEKQVLLAEAGTGTGKSLAYLLPATLWAKGSRQQVIISTNTINLQEQLMSKDIPLLRQQLGEDFGAVVLKGRGNYICRRKWRAMRQQAEAKTLPVYLRLAHWLTLTNSGDFSELNLWGQEYDIVQQLNAGSESCVNFNCPFQRKYCFVSQIRRKAQQADLLIINHSLLLTVAQLGDDGAGVLPPARYLIVDEAHQLPAVAQRQFSQRFSSQQIQQQLGRHWLHLRPADMLRTLRKLPNTGGVLTDKLNQAIKAYEKIPPCCNVFDKISSAMMPHITNRYLRIEQQRWDTEIWQPVESALGNLFFVLKQFQQALAELLHQLSDKEDPYFSVDAVAALQTVHSNATELLDVAQLILDGKNLQTNEACVIWLERNGNQQADPTQPPEWWVAPYDIRPLLNRCVYQDKEAIVFTSATMATAQDFSYFSNELGLSLQNLPLRTCLLPSPFDYQQNARLLLANDIDEYNKTSEMLVAEQLAKAIARLTLAAGGRTLVLFTAYQQLNAVYNLLRPLLHDSEIQLLGHNISGSRSFLLETMQANPQTCVLGVNSFWEGVDIKGANLSLLIIIRLPFAPPGSPIMEAKFEQIREDGGNPFREYSLPQAIIRFKQGFGRLIRSKEDRGLCCVLDRRIWNQKSYGKRFLASLPQMPTQVCSTEQMEAEIKRFLK